LTCCTTAVASCRMESCRSVCSLPGEGTAWTTKILERTAAAGQGQRRRPGLCRWRSPARWNSPSRHHHLRTSSTVLHGRSRMPSANSAANLKNTFAAAKPLSRPAQQLMAVH
jgi:hypothetical protein